MYLSNIRVGVGVDVDVVVIDDVDFCFFVLHEIQMMNVHVSIVNN